MQVGFETPSIGAMCNSGRQLILALGIESADRVKDLLFFLDAAPTLADLSESPPVLRRQVAEDLPPSFSVGKAGNGQVLFRPQSFFEGQQLHDIDRISVISVGGTV
ncbi:MULTISPECIES: hypothetical protein [Roseobacteraceae]|uniref:Uncharacterized protein n=1 Tax=Marivita geojedonensis TaxID=1123756 RepID=A0A1X4NJK9_9RHOB|nr:hypothetical protein [Marivita geojedonensis]OSQ49811.1 hypothetical protein MGEO_13390 [Marivita geojedonensis]PRY75816.1 hypothetical protein CLV76_11329 [Marivita geojedonensis]